VPPKPQRCPKIAVLADWRRVRHGAPGVTRTRGLRFRKPQTPDANDSDEADLRQARPPLSAPLQRAGQNAPNAAEIPPDLAELTAAWPRLPEAVKAGIVAMVRTAIKQPRHGAIVLPDATLFITTLSALYLTEARLGEGANC